MRRQGFLIWLGCAISVALVALRMVNGYGDPVAWSARQDWLWTLMSFLNANKYPLSLLFLLMTLGPMLLLLAAFELKLPRVLRPALVFGKVPLFFYIGHFFLIHILASATNFALFGRLDNTFHSPDLAHYPFTALPGWGFGVSTLMVIWFAVLGLMCPLCRWYMRLKQERTLSIWRYI
jgi:hypothetical protein